MSDDVRQIAPGVYVVRVPLRRFRERLRRARLPAIAHRDDRAPFIVRRWHAQFESEQRVLRNVHERLLASEPVQPPPFPPELADALVQQVRAGYVQPAEA